MTVEVDKALVRWKDEYNVEVKELKTRFQTLSQEIKSSLPKDQALTDDALTRSVMLKLHAELSRTKMGDKHEGVIIGDTGKENYIEKSRSFAEWQYNNDKDVAVSKGVASYDGTPLYTGKGKYKGTPLDKLPQDVLDNSWSRTIFVNEKGNILPVRLWRKDVDGNYPLLHKVVFSATQRLDNTGNITNLNLRSGTLQIGDVVLTEEAFKDVNPLAFKDFVEGKTALIEGYVVEIEPRESSVLVHLNDPLLETDDTVIVSFPPTVPINTVKDSIAHVLGRIYRNKKSGKWGINGYSISSDKNPTPIANVSKEDYHLEDDTANIDEEIAKVLKD